MTKRVAITGIGVISSIGIGKDDFWSNLTAGKSGIGEISSFDTSGLENHRGGEIKHFDPLAFGESSIPGLDKKGLPRQSGNGKLGEIGRASQLVLAATKLAINDAKLDIFNIGHKHVGIVIGTTMGESQVLEEINRTWFEKGEEEVNPALILEYPDEALADNISLKFSLRNNNLVIPTACAAGNYSIGYGFDLIRRGKAKAIIAGGGDAFSRIAFIGFSRLFAMAPEKCQPFDKDRKGMMVGEGSGILILEELESAKKRGANIYAEILGYGLSCDAFHMTAPRVEGIVKVMNKAIKNSGVKREDIGYISAHGTGTPANDKAESDAIHTVFGEEAKNVPVSSIKSMLGHTMGAASAIEAVTCTLAIKQGVIPPTINYETPDPECTLDYVPNTSRKKALKVALNNSYAFGGNNACLVLGKA